MNLLDFIDTITVNQLTYSQYINELEVAKKKLLIKLKKEDDNVKKFVESKLYLILKSNFVKGSNKYEYYLKSVDDYKNVITKEIFDILMKEG